MVTRTIENFELSQICDSGQCFRMERKGEGIYSIIAADKYLEAEQHGNECIFYCGEDEFEDFWKGYYADIEYYRDSDGYIFPSSFTYNQYTGYKGMGGSFTENGR